MMRDLRTLIILLILLKSYLFARYEDTPEFEYNLPTEKPTFSYNEYKGAYKKYIPYFTHKVTGARTTITKFYGDDINCNLSGMKFWGDSKNKDTEKKLTVKGVNTITLNNEEVYESELHNEELVAYFTPNPKNHNHPDALRVFFEYLPLLEIFAEKNKDKIKIFIDSATIDEINSGKYDSYLENSKYIPRNLYVLNRMKKNEDTTKSKTKTNRVGGCNIVEEHPYIPILNRNINPDCHLYLGEIYAFTIYHKYISNYYSTNVIPRESAETITSLESMYLKRGHRYGKTNNDPRWLLVFKNNKFKKNVFMEVIDDLYDKPFDFR